MMVWQTPDASRPHPIPFPSTYSPSSNPSCLCRIWDCGRTAATLSKSMASGAADAEQLLSTIFPRTAACAVASAARAHLSGPLAWVPSHYTGRLILSMLHVPGMSHVGPS